MRLLTVKLVAFAAIGGACGALAGEMLRYFLESPLHDYHSLLAGIWFAPVAALTALGIRAALDHHQRGRLRFDAPILASAVLAGAGGLAAFFLGQWIYGDVMVTLNSAGYLQRELFRGLMWGFAGTLVGAVVGPEIPHFSYVRGVVGGLAGGSIGCAVFVAVIAIVGSGEMARLLGSSVFGAALGAATATANLSHARLLLEVRTAGAGMHSVPLGASMVRVGSGADNTLVVPGLPRVLFGYRMINREVIMTDFGTRRKELIRPGWSRTVNGVVLTLKQSS